VSGTALAVPPPEEYMSRTDDRADKKLPVTGEVGSEGGSYADPTYQVAEFEGDLGTTAQAVEPSTDDAQTVDAEKYPTDS
jgi:hypothetical protein